MIAEILLLIAATAGLGLIALLVVFLWGSRPGPDDHPVRTTEVYCGRCLRRLPEGTADCDCNPELRPWHGWPSEKCGKCDRKLPGWSFITPEGWHSNWCDDCRAAQPFDPARRPEPR